MRRVSWILGALVGLFASHGALAEVPRMVEPVRQLPPQITAFGGAYDIVDLGVNLPYQKTYAHGINNQGKIAGHLEMNGIVRAVWWPSGGPGLQQLPVMPASQALDVTEQNVPFGWANAAYLPTTYGFGAGPQSKDVPLGGSANGRMVGFRFHEGKVYALLFPYQGTPWKYLPGVGLITVAWSVNKNGNSVGATGGGFPAQMPNQAIRWNLNGVKTILPGKGAANIGRAYGINDNDVIVGRVGGLPTERAAKWVDNQLVELGSFGGRSSASAINNSGVVVGWSYDADGDVYAFVHKGGKLHNLNFMVDWGDGPKWILQAASAINDSGAIVGYGVVNGQTHAFLLKPKPATAGRYISVEDLKRKVQAEKPSREVVDRREVIQVQQ